MMLTIMMATMTTTMMITARVMNIVMTLVLYGGGGGGGSDILLLSLSVIPWGLTAQVDGSKTLHAAGVFRPSVKAPLLDKDLAGGSRRSILQRKLQCEAGLNSFSYYYYAFRLDAASQALPSFSPCPNQLNSIRVCRTKTTPFSMLGTKMYCGAL